MDNVVKTWQQVCKMAADMGILDLAPGTMLWRQHPAVSGISDDLRLPGKLNAEIEQLRMRNAELDEAVREMEMEMSRERAELARERTRLDRLREETRLEMERMQREGSVRESLVGVNKLREEMAQQRKQPAGATGTTPLNDRLKNFRNRLSE